MKFNLPPTWKESFTKYPNGFSVMEMLSSWSTKANDLAAEVDKKTNKTGDHKGTWQGFRPTQASEAITSILEELVGHGYDNVTVNIPTDFSTLQSAIEQLSKYIRTPNTKITLNIEPGHSLTSGVNLKHGDYSHFTITSGGTVGVSSTFNGAVIRIENGVAPVLDCLVDVGGRGSTGYSAVNSKGHITEYSGVINAPSDGLYSLNSMITANFAKFSGAGAYGILADHASMVTFRHGEAKDCGTQGLYAHQGSTINARSADVSGSYNGIRAFQCATINIRGGKLLNTGRMAIESEQGSRINADETEISSTNDIGIATVCAVDGSVLNISQSTITSNTTTNKPAVSSRQGSTVVLNDVILNSTAANHDIRTHFGGVVACRNVTIPTGIYIESLESLYNTVYGEGLIYKV